MTDYAALFRRRAMMVNGHKNPISHVEAVREAPGGGLHIVAAIYGRNGKSGNFYIPKILREDFEKEKPNPQLDADFRL